MLARLILCRLNLVDEVSVDTLQVVGVYVDTVEVESALFADDLIIHPWQNGDCRASIPVIRVNAAETDYV